MKEKLAQFFQILKKNSKLVLLVLILFVFSFLSFFAYINRFVVLESAIFKNIISLNNRDLQEKIPLVNNKIVSEESVVIDVVERVSQSVVSISYFDDLFQEEGVSIGSGVVISPDGIIVTNKHVIEDEDATFEVVLQDGTRYKIEKIIRDKSKDLALLKINASNLKAVSFADTDKLKLGQKAIAVGNALGLNNTVSVGIVSGLSREVEIEGEMVRNLIQTDAAINPGNSGGALLNSNGDLLGINTAVSSYAENVGFAIPANNVVNLLEKYKNGDLDQNSVPAFLGVVFVFRDLKDYLNKGLPIGPVITAVLNNSPADRAGLKVGDIIVDIDGVEFSDEYKLSDFIKEKNPGDKIRIKVYRKNSIVELEAVLIEGKN